MDIFSIDLTLPELVILRQSLDFVTIPGKDAKQFAALQIKLETEIAEIQRLLTPVTEEPSSKKKLVKQ
tara:strand:- start:1112 stop:1315 length:204 start_codon:yes stop_codon:yes gene_type:complete